MARRDRGPFGGGRELRLVEKDLAEGRARSEIAARRALFDATRMYRDLVATVHGEVSSLLHNKEQKVGELLDVRVRKALGLAEQGLLERLVAAQAKVIEAGIRAAGADDLLAAFPSAAPPTNADDSAGPASPPANAAGRTEEPGDAAHGSDPALSDIVDPNHSVED